MSARNFEVTEDFLVRVDSYTSLIVHRYKGDVPDDVLKELDRLSTEARALYSPRGTRHA